MQRIIIGFLFFFIVISFSTNAVSHTNLDTWSDPVLRTYNFDGETLVINSDYCDITIEPYTDDIIKVLWHVDGKWETDTSLSIIRTSLKPVVTFTESDDRLEISTKNVKLRIDKNPIRFYFYRADSVVMQECASFIKHEGYRGVKLKLFPGEKIYGSGSRALPVDRRGYDLPMFNQNQYAYEYPMNQLNTCIPFFMSSRIYGIFFDNHSLTWVHPGTVSDSLFYVNSYALEYSYYYINGGNYQDILSKYLWLTGNQPLMPRWALGYFQSKYGYEDQNTSLQIMNNMRKEGFPVDVIIHDLIWFDKMGDFQWSKERFPNPAIMLDSLHNMGIKTVLISECYVSQNSVNYPDMEAKKLIPVNDSGKIEPVAMLGDMKCLLDFTDSAALGWIWDKYRPLAASGIDGWWLDLGEPDLHCWFCHHKLGLGINIHNIFGLLWMRHLYEKYREEFSDRRPFFLTRAGWAGLQRYGAAPVCGDEARTFAALRAQVPQMLGMSMSGSSFLHSDGGGYDGCVPGRRDDLYTRWLQLITFQPIMRVHMTENVPVEPIYYPDSVKNIVRDYVLLRYSLLPYNYTLMWRNSTFGRPIAIPMNFDYPGIEKLSNVNDQYFWGDNLLVAPVLDSLVNSRNVILPEGNWINYWTGKKHQGNQTINVDAPLSVLPLFVRSGSFIPKAPAMMSTDEYNGDTLIVDYYPDTEYAATSYTMYDDDGKTPDANLLNQYELLYFNGTAGTNNATITVSKGGYTFKGAPSSRNITFDVINPGFKPGMVFLNNEFLRTCSNYNDFYWNDKGVYYDSSKNRVYVKFTWTGDSSVINITDQPLGVEQSSGANEGISIVKVAPNPFSGLLTVDYNCLHDCDCSICIIDCTGREVLCKSVPSVQGMNRFNIDSGKLATGSYFLVIKTGNTFDAARLEYITK